MLGNAVEPLTLVQAHIANARMLVIATPQTLEVRQMIEAARLLNPNIEVAVRSHNEQEALLLEREGAGKVFVGESELARSMTSFVLARVEAGGLNEQEISFAVAHTSLSYSLSMKAAHDCDVLIIGGGPAGSTMATLTARQGRKVVL